MNKAVFSKLAECAARVQAADIITLVGTLPENGCQTGKMLIITAGAVTGQLVDEAFTRLVVAKVADAEWQKPVLLAVEYAGTQYRLFWDRLSRRRSALVLGAGHISQPLTAMLAMTGYAVTVVDDRPDFANTARFPQAESVICQDFTRALDELKLSAYGVIIVVTRGHRSDLDCLRAVIAQPAGYVGMIGSQGRVRIVMNTLAEEGVDREALLRLRAPIGLDIGAETPAEIALSIASEIVAVNRSGSCQPLSDKWRCKPNG